MGLFNLISLVEKNGVDPQVSHLSWRPLSQQGVDISCNLDVRSGIFVCYLEVSIKNKSSSASKIGVDTDPEILRLTKLEEYYLRGP